MKLFYSQDGSVVGQVEGANQYIEQAIEMPGLESIPAPTLVSDVINDPYTRIGCSDLVVQEGEIILKDFGISLSEVSQPETPAPQGETPQL